VLHAHTGEDAGERRLFAKVRNTEKAVAMRTAFLFVFYVAAVLCSSVAGSVTHCVAAGALFRTPAAYPLGNS
jgi:hypothetical protein